MEYEIIEYKVCNVKTWIVKDSKGMLWFPISEIMKHVFLIKHYSITRITKEQERNSIRVRLVTPRKALLHIPKNEQPKDVFILGNLWCIKNIIRTKLKLDQDPKYRGRDMLVEEFSRIWGFSAKGFGVLTRKVPNLTKYPFMEQLAIAAEGRKEWWLKCIECEAYYPKTPRFFGSSNTTCEKCLGRKFGIYSIGTYERLEEFFKDKKIKEK